MDFDEYGEPIDAELEREIKISEIAGRHALELYNRLVDANDVGAPVSVEYVEELFRCAIEEAVGDDGRQRAKPGYDPLADRFPLV